MDRQDVYHHYDSEGPKFSIKIEKNSRSVNFEVSVSGAKTGEEARELLRQAKREIDLFIQENNLQSQ